MSLQNNIDNQSELELLAKNSPTSYKRNRALADEATTPPHQVAIPGL